MPNSTKESLAEALASLLKDRTLDQITVKDITDYCDVNRQTFYYHFKDVYDVLEWIYKNKLEKASIEMFSLEEWYEGFVFFFNALLEQRDLFMNAYTSLGEDLDVYLVERTRFTVAQYAKKHYSHISIKKSDFDFVVDVYTAMFVKLIKDWFDQGMVESYEHVLKQFYTLMHGSMDFAFRQFTK